MRRAVASADESPEVLFHCPNTVNESNFNLKLVLPLITIEGICRKVNLSLETQELHQKNSKSLLPLQKAHGPEESAGKPS